MQVITESTLATQCLTHAAKVTGLVHDLGKLLFLFGSQGQWDVVGVRLSSQMDAPPFDT